MSSTPTNPYKSRLLNLINRQSLRLKDKLNRTGRQLKFAVEMGVQILVYPLYLLVQTGRLTQRQIQQKIEQHQFLPSESSSKVQSEAITCDRPIGQILDTLEPWLSESQGKISASALSPPLKKSLLSSFNYSPIALTKNVRIQGLATLLESKKIVLVSTDNFLIDIFSATQQEQLRQRIHWEIANYQYQRRLQLRASRKYLSLIPSFQINSPNVLPPIRWFWTAMRWIQTGEVASAVNLFGELTLIRRSSSSTPLIPVEKKNNSFQLESKSYSLNSLKPLDNYRVNLGRIQVIIQAAVEYFSGQGNIKAINNNDSSLLLSSATDQISSHLNNTSISQQNISERNIPLSLSQKPSLLNTAEPDPFQLQVLIQAAIDYFFGRHQKPSSLKGSKTTASLSTPSESSQPLFNVPEPDSWLSWDDLFSQNAPQNNGEISADSILNQSLKISVTETPIKAKKSNLITQIKQTVIERSKTKSLTPEKPSVSQVSTELDPHSSQEQTQPSLSPITGSKSVLTPLTSISPQNNQLEATPEWIETEAKTVGYVKHPLVKILEGLDRLIFWLEECWLKFLDWLKRH